MVDALGLDSSHIDGKKIECRESFAVQDSLACREGRSALMTDLENESYDFRKAVVLTTDNVKVYGIVDMATFIRNDGLDTFA